MQNLALTQVLIYSFALWFGLYLLSRNPRKAGLIFAGLGLVAYAVGIGLDLLAIFAPDLLRLRAGLRFLPALFWLGASLHLLPDTVPNRARDGSLILAALLVPLPGIVLSLPDWLFDLAALALAALALWRLWRAYQAQRDFGLLLIVAIFFVLSNAALLLPPETLSSDWIVLALGGDLAVLAYLIVVRDAYDEGEALLPDFLRSLGVAMIAALIFGGQVLVSMAIGTGVTAPMLLLLLAVIATALALQTFATPLYALLDRLLLARFPALRRERATLRAVETALPRQNPALDPLALDEAEFTRLTRRALSNLGDIGRLASSPLTRLPQVESRLHSVEASASSLERAAALRLLLAERIEKLKPPGESEFGTSDAWRYYNALYFPYVAGLKPYSRRFDADLDPETRAVLDWFQINVPERTLYNWQNAAAKLIAQDLREQVRF
jgi:hypothetical protein